MGEYTEWTARDAAQLIAVPVAGDDKYSRGVLGVITGSTEFPGAAILGVEAALHTGVGMVRYLGPRRASELVLARRPETVTTPGSVQAWLIGSGMDAAALDGETVQRLDAAFSDRVPMVLDAGALHLHGRVNAPVIITPHYRELAKLLDVDSAEIARDPGRWCARAAELLGVTVLLKGNRTHVADQHGTMIVTPATTPWLATAGTGDALGGILGALLATHSEAVLEEPRLAARLAAAASVIHALAGDRASAGGPFTVLGLIAAVPATIASLLRERR